MKKVIVSFAATLISLTITAQDTRSSNPKDSSPYDVRNSQIAFTPYEGHYYGSKSPQAYNRLFQVCKDTSSELQPPALKKEKVYRKNNLLINLSSLAFRNYSFYAERSIAPKISFVAGYRFMANQKATEIPIIEFLRKKSKDVEILDDLDELSIGNKTYTAEIRLYGGRQPGSRGFYFSLFGRYARFNMKYDFKYSANDKVGTLPLSGDIKGIAGGIMLGQKWIIAERVTLDWFLLGGLYGQLNGRLTSAGDFTNYSKEEKAEVKDQLDNVLVIGDKHYFDATVSNNSASLNVKGPFIGLRGGGLSIGIAF